MTAPSSSTHTSDSPIIGPRDHMSPSISDAGAFAPNFHNAETDTDIKPVTTSSPRPAPSSEPQSKEVSPSASPRIRISLKGGSSEPESPASMARDVPPSSSAQPSDSNSNSNSSAHTSASEAPSLPATTINTATTGSGSISGNIAPLSPSRRPFSFRDVSDINEPSQIRVQSARLHHDAYDPKKSCSCCERQEREPEKDKEKDKDKDKDKESEIKGADGNTTKAHADTNGTTKNKTAATSPTSASASASAPASSPRAKKSSPWFGLCGICIAIRNCLAPEDMEYRCSHGRPCSHPKHRHSKGC